jgi:hypothetical protein
MTEPVSAEQQTRVFVHVGAPKTGTTYLQRRLFRNREALAARGVLYPYGDPGQSFRSMNDFRGTGWGANRPEHYAGEWEAVAGRVRGWGGPTAIVSNELLGNAAPDRISAGLARLGDAEVHVVFTARDFARQLVSDWQEHVKHKHTVTLDKFVDDLVRLGIDAPSPFGEMFWGLHDAARVLQRWESVVPAERIHVITLPDPSGPADALWRRFCSVTGIDPKSVPELRGRANTSMGVVETEFVRRLNKRVRRMPARDYDPLVRRKLAEGVLGNRSGRLTLPPEHVDWSVQRSRELVDVLRARGYRVVGDLEELVPRPEDHAEHVAPSTLGAKALAPVATRATVGLLRVAAKQRRQLARLRDQAAPGSQAEQPAAAAPVEQTRLTRLRHRSRRAR